MEAWRGFVVALSLAAASGGAVGQPPTGYDGDQIQVADGEENMLLIGASLPA